MKHFEIIVTYTDGKNTNIVFDEFENFKDIKGEYLDLDGIDLLNGVNHFDNIKMKLEAYMITEADIKKYTVKYSD